MREREVEAWLVRQIARLGGLAIKLTSPGNNGAPDRIVILPGGRVIFVELKTQGERPTAIQQWQQKRLRRLGCEVRTVRGMDEARRFMEEVMRP